MSLSQKIAVLVITALILAFQRLPTAGADVTATSTDGEATVYVFGNFSSDFDLAYNARFNLAPSNRSWTTVSMLLMGSGPQDASLSVGLTRGYPKVSTLSGFTTSNAPGQQGNYQSFRIRCRWSCLIELRGTKDAVHAILSGHVVGSWNRRVFTMTRPYIQLNGEVHQAGDKISAELKAIRATVRGLHLKPPACAFTTQGVEVRAIKPAGSIEFFGSRHAGARVTYFSLLDGVTGNSCPG
jgi:hypothetical protein